MRREVRFAWAGANALLAVALLGSLVLATHLTIPLIVAAIVLNVLATALTS